MNTSELRSKSYRQLTDLIERAQEVLEEKGKEEKARVRNLMAKVAEDNGFKFQDLIGSKMKSGFAKRGHTANHTAPKYRNPSNPSETWSGRGRPPRWFDKSSAQQAG